RRDRHAARLRGRQARAAGAGLLRVSDAVHDRAERRGQRAARAALRHRQGVSRRHLQLQPARDRRAGRRQEGHLPRGGPPARCRRGLALPGRRRAVDRGPHRGDRLPLRLGRALQAVRARQRDRRAHARRAHLALLLRRGVRTPRPAPRARRGVGRAHRLVGRPAAALLLPLRSRHRALQPGGAERGSRRRHPHAGRAGRLRRPDAAPRCEADAPPVPSSPRARDTMLTRLQLFPEQASTLAPQTDALFLFLLGITAFFVVLIAGSINVFMVYYRRRDPHAIPPPIHGSLALEIGWSVIPFILVMIVFFGGARLYATIARPPDDAINIDVVGKQWMWKIQHMEGRREINELHIPVGKPVKLTMTSEDVIHAFFVPAFRTKQDVVPGRYTTSWFEATKAGTYHLFCAEYCGT